MGPKTMKQRLMIRRAAASTNWSEHWKASIEVNDVQINAA